MERERKKYPFEEAAQMLKVMGHPVRIMIVSALEKKALSVAQIQDEVSQKQSMTSQHLKPMVEKKILKRSKRGNKVFYSINKKEVLKLLSCIKGCCNNE